MRHFGLTLAALIILSAFITATGAGAAVHKEEITYQAGETILKGYLAYDDSLKDRRPGVLVVHEWWGLNDYAKRRADQLAQLGYLALAVDMYGEGKATEHPKDAQEWSGFIRQNPALGRDRFLAAHELLRNHPLAQADNIAAIGYCFGGSVVLSMALQGLPLKGVVSFHGALPDLKAEPGTVKAKILVCHGADDSFIKPEVIATFQENLRTAGADWQFIFYGGAKHSFTVAEADQRGVPGLGYNKAADLRSWQAMLLFLKEIMGPEM